MEDNSLVLKLKLTEVVSLWQSYCKLHTELYDLTCDEYVHLLASDMDSLEETLELKSKLIETINESENNRLNIVSEINEIDTSFNINKIVDIVSLCKNLGHTTQASHLEKYNALLLDIINKIQDQNKMNQLFLNKAIHSLRDLKESFSGQKSYKTYGANGMARSKSVNP